MAASLEDFPRKAELQQMIENTPPAGKHHKIAAIAGVATLGSFLFGYDTGVISGALPYMYMVKQAGGLFLSSFEEGLIGGFLLIGAAIGALIGGRLSDRYGRRHNLIMLSIIFILGALGTTFSPTLWFMYLARFVLGFAVGGASATVPVYLAEMAPRRIRGTVVSIDQLMIVVGQLAAFTFNAIINGISGGPKATIISDPTGQLQPGTVSWDAVNAVTKTMSGSEAQQYIQNLVIQDGNGNAWRYMFILCTIPAILLWLGMRIMPDSPRWYAVNMRYIEAIGTLKQIRDDRDDPLDFELGEIIDNQETLAHRKKGTWRDVLGTPWLAKLLVVGMIVGASNQFTGVNTVMYYAPKVLEYAGMGTSAAITAQVANGVMSVLGAAAGLYLVYKFRRRSVLLFCIGSVAVILGVIGGVFATAIEPHIENGTAPSASVAYIVLILMGVFMLIVQSSNGPVVWTMLGEMFPSFVRGIMNGWCVFFLWICNALVTILFPVLLDTFGGGTTYAIFAVVNVVMFITLWKIMPETSGKSMEEIEVMMQERYSK
ncbi:MAG: MFS transporter [Actinomycetaceae bacterium]|nr:MFS transporter [Actinomycetaceae bacterium]MDY6082274.1 MFS transporter [Actinomycetaceae bacterium]